MKWRPMGAAERLPSHSPLRPVRQRQSRREHRQYSQPWRIRLLSKRMGASRQGL